MNGALGTVFAVSASVIAAAIMAASHYLAPRIRGDDMSAPATYIYGCLIGILLPFAAWALGWWAFIDQVMAAWIPVLVLAGVMVGAGIGTVLCYLVDAIHGMRVTDGPKSRNCRG